MAERTFAESLADQISQTPDGPFRKHLEELHAAPTNIKERVLSKILDKQGYDASITEDQAFFFDKELNKIASGKGPLTEKFATSDTLKRRLGNYLTEAKPSTIGAKVISRASGSNK